MFDSLAITRWNHANRRSIEAYWADKEMPAGVCETPGCGRRVGARGVRRCVFCRQANYKRSS